MIRRTLAALWLRFDLGRAVRRRRRTIRRLAREANRADAEQCQAVHPLLRLRCVCDSPHALPHAAHHNDEDVVVWMGDGSTPDPIATILAANDMPHVPRHEASFPRPMSHHTRNDR